MMRGSDEQSRRMPCTMVGREGGSEDNVSVEEPLEILIDGRPVSVVMRTPGHDEDLVRGFLLSEGIVSGADMIAEISADYGRNRMSVFLDEEAVFDPASLSRHMFSASSCGICGKASIEAVMRELPSRGDTKEAALSESSLFRGLAAMESAQETFEKTGGLHAAGLCDLGGELHFLREDVGRHNAVDKVIGQAAEQKIDLSRSVLLVSGRLSFEIVQKCAQVGIAALAGVSAPSSLAVDFAKEAGMTLIGFLRPPRYNIYHEGRITILR